MSYGGSHIPLYEWMAVKLNEWNEAGNVGVVAGATYPGELGKIRERCPGMPMLVPGIGAQGGDLEGSLGHGLDADIPNLLISSSRGIIYASSDAETFAEAAGRAALDLRDSINGILELQGRSW